MLVNISFWMTDEKLKRLKDLEWLQKWTTVSKNICNNIYN